MMQAMHLQANSVDALIPAELSSQIDLLISLHLWSWPALTLAIQNSWGGSPQVSADKRDWFAGAVSELLASSPPQLVDVSDLEEVLLQVMLDEFEVVVDDGSAEDTARKIWNGVKKLACGETTELEVLFKAWELKTSKAGDQVSNIVRGEDHDGEETDWDEEDEDGEDWNGFTDNHDKPDVEMNDAPLLVDASKIRQKVEPQIDEDGFTTVIGKRKK